MRELPLAISYLKGRPIRSIMTIISIVIGVTIMFGLNGMAQLFERCLFPAPNRWPYLRLICTSPAGMGGSSARNTSKMWLPLKELTRLPV